MSSQSTATIETPVTIHGRLLEAVHMAGYTLSRAKDELIWLLEDPERWREAGFESPHALLDSLSLKEFRITAGERKEIVRALQQFEVSQRAAAKLLGVGQKTVSRDVNESDDSPADKKASNGAAKKPERESNDSPAHIQRSGEDVNDSARAKGKLDVHYSSDGPEWYTPRHIIDAVVHVLGEIDLDPCSNSGEPNVPAKMHYTASADGLVRPWRGRVYMNPPYGDVIPDWTSKLLEEFDAGLVSEAIALVPARTDTKWFSEFFDFPICFVHGRLRFNDAETGAPFPSALVYLGERGDVFVDAFTTIGAIVRRFE